MEKNKKKSAGVVIIIILALVLMSIGGYVAYINLPIANYVSGLLGLLIALLGLIVILFVVVTYNKLIAYKNKVEESLSLIDVQLKHRFDLIPNLVSTVKGYAKHEKEVFTQITELRNKAVETKDEKEKIELGNATLPKLRQIIAIAEDYPELRADALFKSLMEELILIEDKIVACRRFYDSNVNQYNTLVQVWPQNMIAKMFGHTRLEMYTIEAGERLNIKIEM